MNNKTPFIGTKPLVEGVKPSPISFDKINYVGNFWDPKYWLGPWWHGEPDYFSDPVHVRRFAMMRGNTSKKEWLAIADRLEKEGSNG